MINLIKKLEQSNKKTIIYLLITLVSLFIMDALLTQFLVPTGAAREANPFLAHLIGKTGFMVVKIIGGLLCAFILWDVSLRHPKLAKICSWIAVVGYGAIVIWNASLIILTLH